MTDLELLAILSAAISMALFVLELFRLRHRDPHPFGARHLFLIAASLVATIIAFHLNKTNTSVAVQNQNNSTSISDQQHNTQPNFSVSQPNPKKDKPTIIYGSQPNQFSDLAGLYRVERTGALVQLNSDGSFAEQFPDGRLSPGHFAVNGHTLICTYKLTGRSSIFTIEGNKIYANSGLAWIRESDSPNQFSNIAGWYRVERTGAHMRLNLDGSFIEQHPDGRVSPGHFNVYGSTLILTYTQTGGSSSFVIQGEKIYANSGLAWTPESDSLSH